MRVGFATLDITPEIGSDIPGGFSPRVSTGIRDPLQAQACVVEGDDDRLLAVVSVDAVWVPDATVAAARERACAETELNERDICIAATHTHCGGPSHSVLGTDVNPTYSDLLAERISEAVVSALGQRVEAELIEAADDCPDWAFNRRWVLPDGSHKTNPGKDNPEVLHPAGPVDPELRVLAFRDTQGTWLGAITNYTCHSTVMWGSEFSADYAGCWRNALAERSGNAAFCMVFLNGACGDINQFDFANPDVREAGPEWAKRMGAALADCTWKSMTCEEGNRKKALFCNSAHGEVTVPCRVPTPEQLAADQALATSDEDWTSAKWQARDRLLLAERLGDATTSEQPIDVYRIGETLIAAAPWQPFCEYGLRLKADAGKPLMVATFANGGCGYVPTPAGFEGGGYEPTLCRGSFLAPSAGDLMTGALLDLSRGLS
ncbi:MAG: hypothetical protein HN742_17230 [Lentisphaerae bacterium]|jgi:neutral ceramidase|nr:hypothetical protein [Lentisphaerota bacterium]MBT5606905.1 hypothetical protein [Lentisphaerota bacterium]MBT7055519.1 hypothetical protein [Lentisphaerota bacterium]MBT7843624.1 hypothetical protein [Lentisphaerota bacterium]